MAENYDAIERFVGLLSSFDWKSLNVEVIRAYNYKNIDLRTGDYIVLERSSERDEFFGIGGLEYVRYVSVSFSIMTAVSRERLREISWNFRKHLRSKENWNVGGKLMLNVRLSRIEDRSDVERGIFNQYGEVEWFEIEKVVT